jgi:copper chaperone NosL
VIDQLCHSSALRGAEARPDRSRRWLAVGLVLIAVALLGVSYFQTWWSFTLYAPQYPQGLRLDVSLTGVGGDVREIDTLNHYIGMSSLATAASLERALAGYGIALLSALVVLSFLLLGRRLGRLALLPALMLPLGFVVDSMYWLYRFGHDLDPRAPLEIPPFTPQMFGNGEIGQFMTYAEPQLGFWIAAGAIAILAVGVFVRQRVCEGCSRRFVCGTVCPSAFIGPTRPLRARR